MATHGSPSTKDEDSAPNRLEAPEIVHVHTRRVSCDGVGGALGHPRVFYDIGASGFVECLYCDRRFVLDGDGHDEH
jgi:uncharacterized Zn-finger protein